MSNYIYDEEDFYNSYDKCWKCENFEPCNVDYNTGEFMFGCREHGSCIINCENFVLSTMLKARYHDM